ncbi:MAG: cytochrome c biogenesis protein CcsA [Alphaproteobacteria bacterium]|nr:cytochrome c biogenesis protein CcsA [Alphaproteobacteria bacterium]
MLSEFGNFLLAMGLGFASLQVLASTWGVYNKNQRYLTLGRTAAFFQGGFLSGAFLTLIIAFLLCDFSLILVSLHDHTQLPWYYRMAASWGNHEGSLLLFILILSGMAVAQAIFLKDPLFRARALTSQGFLILLFLFFLIMTSNPFTLLPFILSEGKSLNPLLQDRGLLVHPPLLYLGYVGFSAPFSLAIAALWGEERGPEWARLTRPWALFSWSALTAGITLGSWWAYYELGWGGWWFWDPVENASFMPWLAGTALLHTLRTGQLYRWSLFLSLLTFGLSLLGTFLVRSGLITSIHSFAQDPEKGLYILCLLGLIMGVAFFVWIWKSPRLQTQSLELMSRNGALFVNSLFFCLGLGTVFLGTFYPLLSDYVWGKTVAIGAPYFERTFIPLMLPLLILLPVGCLFREKNESGLRLLMAPLTAVLGAIVLILYHLYPLSLWAFTGIVASVWVIGGTAVAYKQARLSLGPTLAHIGVGLSLLGVSVGGGLRTDEMGILGLGESLSMGGTALTLQNVQQGKEGTYLYERVLLSYETHQISPEKRLYKPQDMLMSKTAIHTNGFRDLYVILGPYQGNNRWLIRASIIPLAPWVWIGGFFMVLGGVVSILGRVRVWEKKPSSANKRASFPRRREPRKTLAAWLLGSRLGGNDARGGCKWIIVFFLLLSSPLFAATSLEKRAAILYQEVRCPICLGQSIADSETDESQALKTFILEKLQHGESEEDIREKLRHLMGDDILLRPPFEDHTLFLWVAPFGLFLLIGLGVGWKVLRSLAHKKGA